MKYEILEEWYPSKLSAKVESYLDDSWVLYGELIVTYTPEGIIYNQVMIKSCKPES